MPQPDSSQFVSVPLTNVSVAYQQDNSMFIADQIFPQVGVDMQGGLYYEYLMDDWTRSIAEPRAPGTESAGGGWDVKTNPYFATVYAVHKDLDDQTRQNAVGSGAFNLERDATQWVTQNLLIKRDRLWMNSYMVTTVWSADITPAIKWDAANATPINDVLAQQLAIGELTGRQANTLVLGARVLPALLNCQQIVDRVKYTGSGFPTTAVLAQAFNVDRIVVAQAIENSAPKGATMSTAYMASKSALLVYAAPNPGLMTPSAGYTFAWTGLLGAGATGTRIKRFRMEEIESDRIEGEMAFQMLLVGKSLGVFFPQAIT